MQLVACRDNAPRDLVPAGDAAEDVDEYRANLGILEDHVETQPNLLGLRAATHVEEIGRTASGGRDQVEGVHDQPRSVAHNSNFSVQMDVRQRPAAGFDLERIATSFFITTIFLQVPVPKLGALVDLELAVQRDQLTAG